MVNDNYAIESDYVLEFKQISLTKKTEIRN